MAMEKGETSGLAAACEALQIGDDEDGVIIEVEDVVTPVFDFRFSAVGRVVSERPVKLVVFRDIMATAWQPQKGVHVRELSPNRFLFTFFHEKDVSRVMNDGPWTFDHNLVLFLRLEQEDDQRTVELVHSQFWIQVHNLPFGFMPKKVAKVIGNFVGEFVAVDQRNFEGIWKSFMRVRVFVNVATPLKKRMKMKKPGGSGSGLIFDMSVFLLSVSSVALLVMLIGFVLLVWKRLTMALRNLLDHGCE